MKYKQLLPITFICFLFFIAYSTLSVVKHNHFLSGYDLAIVDQAVWHYATFSAPITTVQAYTFTSLLTDHLEIIYILISPLFWIWNDVRLLLLAQAATVAFSGIAVYLLAKEKKLVSSLCYVLTISYLAFYGIQFALWSDVHSLVFAVGFLPWYLLFLEKKKVLPTLVFLILALLCKEDIALLTGSIAAVYFLVRRDRLSLSAGLISAVYLLLIFLLYFPFFTQDGYRYRGNKAWTEDLSFFYLFDTKEKQQVYFYSLAWFGFLPFGSLFQLLPALLDVGHYFVLGKDIVTSAQGLFMHYRSSLSLLLAWPTIYTIARWKQLNTHYVALYLLLCCALLQYHLHLPLSYLSKSWFWKEPEAVAHIQVVLAALPKDAPVVAQSNITPHITHRAHVFTLWPQVRGELYGKPCGKAACHWFRWDGRAEYLIVDTSSDWDIRHLLTNREDFLHGIANLETYGVLTPVKKSSTATLYRIQKPLE